MYEKGLEYKFMTLFTLLSIPFLYAQALPLQKNQKEDSTPIRLEKIPLSQNKKSTKDMPSREARILEVKKPSPEKKNNKKAEKKDAVLEELKLANQGLVTDDTNSDTPPSITDSNKKETPQEPQPKKEPASLEDKLKQLEQKKTELFAYFPTKQNFEKLMKKYISLLESHPNESPIYWALFHLMHDYTQWTTNTPLYNPDVTEEAMGILQTIKEKFNEINKTTIYLCQYLMLNSFKTEGLEQCNQAIKQHPKNPMPYVIKFQHSKNKTDRNLLSILKKFPSSPEVLVAVGQHFKEKTNYQLSQKYIEKALNINSNFEKALFEMAEVLFLKQEYKQALTYYIKICEKHHMKARRPFRKAKSQLSQKNLFNLANEYQNEINQCISNTRLSPQHSSSIKMNVNFSHSYPIRFKTAVWYG